MGTSTCNYTSFKPDMGLPVRTSIGAPRFRLSYGLEAKLPILYPTRDMLRLPLSDYRPRYTSLLDSRGGVPAIQHDITHLQQDFGYTNVVLLCFCSLAVRDRSEAWCHRRLFGAYMLERTGEVVPELSVMTFRDAEVDGADPKTATHPLF